MSETLKDQFSSTYATRRRAPILSSSEDLNDELKECSSDLPNYRTTRHFRESQQQRSSSSRLPWWIDSFTWEYFFLSRREYEHLIDEIIYQYSLSKKRLQSKREALLIVANDLEVCMEERAELVSVLKKYMENCECPAATIAKIDTRDSSNHAPTTFSPNHTTADKGRSKELSDINEKKVLEKYVQHGSSSALGNAVRDLMKQRNILREEVDSLNQRLKDSLEDIKLLRQTVAKQRSGDRTFFIPSKEAENPRSEECKFEQTLDQLEAEKTRIAELEMELEACKDCMKQLRMEKEFFMQRAERLNRELNYLLSNESDKSIVDIDALTLENKYLKEHVAQLNAEKQSIKEQCVKLQQNYEEQVVASKSSSNTGVKSKFVLFGGTKQAMKSLRQIRQYLLGANDRRLPVSEKFVGDLHGLASTLVECLDDKTVALYHQKNTNKALGLRVRELERKLKTLENSGLWSTTEREKRLNSLRREFNSGSVPEKNRHRRASYTSRETDTSQSFFVPESPSLRRSQSISTEVTDEVLLGEEGGVEMLGHRMPRISDESLPHFDFLVLSQPLVRRGERNDRDEDEDVSGEHLIGFYDLNFDDDHFRETPVSRSVRSRRTSESDVHLMFQAVRSPHEGDPS